MSEIAPAPNTQVQDPDLAYEMAHAEKPHRDEIIERNRQRVLADEAAEKAIEGWIEDSTTMTTSEVIEIKKAQAKREWDTIDANLDSEAAAEDAAHTAQVEHYGGKIIKV